jgi:hypothetical protein
MPSPPRCGPARCPGPRRAPRGCRCRPHRSLRRRRRSHPDRQACRGAGLRPQRQRGRVQHRQLPLEDAAQRQQQRRPVRLAAGRPDDQPIRADDHQGRPGTDGAGVPEPLPRDDHRMADPVAADRLGDKAGVPLGRELGRVDADHHERLVGQLPLDRCQHGQRVQAVDSGVGPKSRSTTLPSRSAGVSARSTLNQTASVGSAGAWMRGMAPRYVSDGVWRYSSTDGPPSRSKRQVR